MRAAIPVPGLHCWARSEFFEFGEHKLRRAIESSMILALSNSVPSVMAYECSGLGESNGLCAFAESFNHLRDVLLELSEATEKKYAGLNRFLVGISMGATTCVLASLANLDVVVNGVVLQPAVHTPSDMFGCYGLFLRTTDCPISLFIPRVKIIHPRLEHSGLREKFSPTHLTKPRRCECAWVPSSSVCLQNLTHSKQSSPTRRL